VIVQQVRHEALLASLTRIPLPTDLCRCNLAMADGNRAVEEPDHDVSSTAGVSVNAVGLLITKAVRGASKAPSSNRAFNPKGSIPA